jgi:glutathione S-transferase
MGGGDPDPERVEKLKAKLASVLDVYERLLVGKQYLLGDELSAVDIFHLANMNVANQAGLGDLWSVETRPNVARWWKNISSLSSFQRALALK